MRRKRSDQIWPLYLDVHGNTICVWPSRMGGQWRKTPSWAARGTGPPLPKVNTFEWTIIYGNVLAAQQTRKNHCNDMCLYVVQLCHVYQDSAAQQFRNEIIFELARHRNFKI
jgi:hypothetical protein